MCLIFVGFINLGWDYMDYYVSLEDYFGVKLWFFVDLVLVGGYVVVDLGEKYVD